MQLYFLHPHTSIKTALLVMRAIAKSPAAKLLAHWNLSVLLILVSAFEVASTVTV